MAYTNLINKEYELNISTRYTFKLYVYFHEIEQINMFTVIVLIFYNTQ